MTTQQHIVSQTDAIVAELQGEIATVQTLLTCHLTPGARAIKEAYLATLEAELEDLLS